MKKVEYQSPNLLSRLKSEHMTTLNELEKSYPASIQIIKRQLRATHFWLDLRFECATDLCSMLKIELSTFSVASLFNENKPIVEVEEEIKSIEN